jgi:C4-type Zn-finger protein
LKLVDRCPHCREDDLTEYHEYPMQGHVIGIHWFECDRCGFTVAAEERDDGQWVPVVEEEED